MKLFFILTIFISLSACSLLNHKEENHGLSILKVASNVQTSYIKSKESYVRFCTETDVDFTQTEDSGFSFSVGYAGSTESAGEESGQGALSLGGRDPAVLIARELMFRACEFILNVNADARLALKVYGGTLDAVVKIARAQKLIGTTSLVATPPKISANTTTSKQISSVPSQYTAGSPLEEENKSKQPKQSSTNDDYDWSYDWDYADKDNSIDKNHP